MSETKFEKAVKIVQGLPKGGPDQPTQDQQLELYKFYKQGTTGDVNKPSPTGFDFTGKAKWNAWNEIKGTTMEEARAKYVTLLLEILKKSDSEDSKKWVAEIEGADS